MIVDKSISKRIVVVILYCSTCVLLAAERKSDRPAKQSLVFTENATGGTLTLSGTPRRYATSVVITNAPGDTPAVVAARLASAANQNPFFVKCHGTISVSSNRLELFGPSKCGSFIFGGTERGLGLPPWPTSCSAVYDFQNDETKVTWENPRGDYDQIVILCNGKPISRLSGDTSSGVHQSVSSRILFRIDDLDYFVVGYKGDLPSNAGAIHVAGNRQEELANFPFCSGVAPNWNAWSNNLQSAEVNFDQGIKSKIRLNAFFKTPDKKPFYQHISGSGKTFVCGTWRKFLGLQSGSIYRISIRVNTLELSPSPNWTFSVHAAYNGPQGTTLTVDQLSGLSPLLDGSTGVGVGRIVEYGGTVSTDGKWRLHSTDTDGPGKVISNITLPAGVDTVTVWTRLIGRDISLSGVGMDWVAVEKLPAEEE